MGNRSTHAYVTKPTWRHRPPISCAASTRHTPETHLALECLRAMRGDSSPAGRRAGAGAAARFAVVLVEGYGVAAALCLLVDDLGMPAIGYRESLSEGQVSSPSAEGIPAASIGPSSAPRRAPGLVIPLSAGRRCWFPAKERAQRSDQPLLVLLGAPAPLDGQDVMDLGGENGVCDVDGLGDFEVGVKGPEGGEGGGYPGLAGVALASDLFHELGGIGIDRGGRREDTHDGRGPLHEVPGD